MESIRKVFFIAMVFILGVFGLFIINQTAQIVSLASIISPNAGKVVLVILLSIYVLITFKIVHVFLKLPKRLELPDSEKSPEYPTYIEELKKRLNENKHIKASGIDLNQPDCISKAITVLDKKAIALMEKTSKEVFLFTAISQFGKLDALVVFFAQLRLTGQIAHIYNQRPSLKELVYLYGNVVATTMLAMELEDSEWLEEHFVQMLTTVIGASVPSILSGNNPASAIAINSILSGASNALLTLRVGVIAKEYCRSTTKVHKRIMLKSATREAIGMLGAVINDSAGLVLKKFMKAFLSKGKQTVSSGADAVMDGVKKFVGGVFS